MLEQNSTLDCNLLLLWLLLEYEAIVSAQIYNKYAIESFGKFKSNDFFFIPPAPASSRSPFSSGPPFIFRSRPTA
jgi:hypothetical protein